MWFIDEIEYLKGMSKEEVIRKCGKNDINIIPIYDCTDKYLGSGIIDEDYEDYFNKDIKE